MSILLFKGDDFTIEVYDTAFSWDRYICRAFLPYKDSLGSNLMFFKDFDKDVKIDSDKLRQIETSLYGLDDRLRNRLLGYDPWKLFKALGWIEE